MKEIAQLNSSRSIIPRLVRSPVHNYQLEDLTFDLSGANWNVVRVNGTTSGIPSVSTIDVKISYIPRLVISQFHCNGAGYSFDESIRHHWNWSDIYAVSARFAKLPANIIVERSRSLCNPLMIPWKKNLNPP